MYNRPQGVTISKSQINAGLEKGPSNTISHAFVVEQVALQWYDENGTAHPDVWLRINGKYYIPPNSEEWAAQLKPVKDVFVHQIEIMLNDQIDKNVAPTQDAVDIVATEVATASPATIDIVATEVALPTASR
jgi:hypothetical protein